MTNWLGEGILQVVRPISWTNFLPISATKPHDYHRNILWPTNIQNDGVANSTILALWLIVLELKITGAIVKRDNGTLIHIKPAIPEMCGNRNIWDIENTVKIDDFAIELSKIELLKVLDYHSQSLMI
jgi:hypothetical protein